MLLYEYCCCDVVSPRQPPCCCLGGKERTCQAVAEKEDHITPKRKSTRPSNPNSFARFVVQRDPRRDILLLSAPRTRRPAEAWEAHSRACAGRVEVVSELTGPIFYFPRFGPKKQRHLLGFLSGNCHYGIFEWKGQLCDGKRENERGSARGGGGDDNLPFYDSNRIR
jgi:hypothetical protein